eukprot:3752752-Prymnesium_polylepis.1
MRREVNKLAKQHQRDVHALDQRFRQKMAGLASRFQVRPAHAPPSTRRPVARRPSPLAFHALRWEAWRTWRPLTRGAHAVVGRRSRRRRRRWSSCARRTRSSARRSST